MVEEKASSSDPQEDPIKLLVVEDDPAMLIAFQDVLKGAGFEVLSASNGEAALELLGHTQPALILSDISMPIMDGYELFEAVRRRPGGSSIPLPRNSCPPFEHGSSAQTNLCLPSLSMHTETAFLYWQMQLKPVTRIRMHT